MGNEVTFVNLPLEVEQHPNLNPMAKKLFWIIDSVCKSRGVCSFSNMDFALKMGRYPTRISKALALLKDNGFILINVDKQAGNRRTLYINPAYKEVNRNLVEKYNNSAKTGVPIAEKGNTLLPKRAIGGDATIDDSDRNFAYILVSNNMKKGSKDPSGAARRGVPPHAIDRVIAYWKSKGKPLVVPKDKTTQKPKFRSAIRKGLEEFSETTVLRAIDVYHNSLLDPTLVLTQFRGAPAKVGLSEFFEFTGFTQHFIDVNRISYFNRMKGWCGLCAQGDEAVRNRFARVCKDTSPKMTQLLHEMLPRVIQFDKRNSRVENILRICARKLTKIHADVKNRIVQAGVTKASSVAFAQVHFFRYLEEQNLEAFKIGWLASDRVLDSFVYYLETVGVLRKPVMTRHLKRRFIDG